MNEFLWRLIAPFWAAILAFLITAYGEGLWGALVFTNLKQGPALPWSVAVMAVLLAVMWLYLDGKGPPRSTSETRRRLLRANPVPLKAVFWSFVAGGCGIAAMTGIWIVMFQLFPMTPNLVPDMMQYPLVTSVLVLMMASLAAPFSEEAAFRGYAQSILERHYPAVVAIVISSLLFALAHFPQGFFLPKLSVYFLAGLAFGTIAYLTNSILASIPVHMAADLTFFTLVWPYDAGRKLVSQGGADMWFWIHVGQAVVFSVLAIFAFRELARVTRNTRALPR